MSGSNAFEVGTDDGAGKEKEKKKKKQNPTNKASRMMIRTGRNQLVFKL